MLNAYLQDLVTVSRRTSTGTDVLGNPTYGQPTTGSGWAIVYTNMPTKLAFSSKQLLFAQTQESPEPSGVMYYNTGYTLLPEDRVITTSNVAYTVVSIVPAISVPNVVDHYEALLKLQVL